MQAVTRKELAEIIGEKTLHLRGRGNLARSVAAYAASEPGSIKDVDSLVRDIMQYRLERGLVEAVAVSAHELSPAVIKDIEDLLKDHFPNAKSVLVDTRLDESVVGGVRIELPQETLDLSVRSKLNTLKRLVSEERN